MSDTRFPFYLAPSRDAETESPVHVRMAGKIFRSDLYAIPGIFKAGGRRRAGTRKPWALPVGFFQRIGGEFVAPRVCHIYVPANRIAFRPLRAKSNPEELCHFRQFRLRNKFKARRVWYSTEGEHHGKENTMLQWAITFLIIALIAAILGFGGVAAISVEMARLLFGVFIVLFIIAAVMHVLRGRAPPRPRL
jgi:uncharacterized membrane protein YtjA (UPF0391 family)